MASAGRGRAVREFRFGEYVLQPGGGGLYRDGEPVPLRRKSADVLAYLVAHAGRVVSRDELLANVWGGSRDLNVVEQCIHELRTRLGDRAKEPAYIQTVHGVGYRFLPSVEAVEDGPGPDADREPAEQAGPEAAESRRTGQPERWWKRSLWLAAGLAAVAAGVLLNRHQPGSPARRPEITRVAVAGRELRALDVDGNLVWRHQLSEPAATLAPEEMSRRVWFLSRGGGAPGGEILVAVPEAGRSAGAFAHRLLCFSEAGKLRWEYAPRERLEFGERTFDGGWEIQKVAPAGDAVWVAVKHEIWWPSFVARIESGRPETVFVNSGAIFDLALFGAQGRRMAAIAGVNNEYETAALAVIPLPAEPAFSPQSAGSPYRCRSCAGGPAFWYALLPRTDVTAAAGQPYGVGRAVRVPGSSIEVEVEEAPDVNSFYQFTLDLQPAGFAVSDNYAHYHDQHAGGGRLRHVAAECPQLKRARRVRIFVHGRPVDFEVRRSGSMRATARPPG